MFDKRAIVQQTNNLSLGIDFYPENPFVINQICAYCKATTFCHNITVSVLTFHVYQRKILGFYWEEVSPPHQPHLQSVNKQEFKVKNKFGK